LIQTRTFNIMKMIETLLQQWVIYTPGILAL
jgi:hypothetical protein